MRRMARQPKLRSSITPPLIIIIIMSFYCPFAVVGLMEMCSPGEWQQKIEHQQGGNNTMITVCSLCPVGMQCIGDRTPPAPCPSGTASIAPGAALCCLRTAICPPGTSVSDGCACAPISCTAPLRALIRAGGGDLQCVDAAFVIGAEGEACPPCQTGLVMDAGCACTRVNDCRSSDGSLASWWRTAQQRFVCMF
jgi:hypothetical protein